MAVYFLLAEESDTVKIGYAADVWKRIAGINTGSHENLILLRVIDGGRSAEQAAHTHFSHLRVKREWFRFDDALFDFGKSIDIGPKPHRKLQSEGEVSAAINALGGTVAVARLMNVEHNAVSNWRKRGIPGRHHLALAAICRAKGVDWPRAQEAA